MTTQRFGVEGLAEDLTTWSGVTAGRVPSYTRLAQTIVALLAEDAGVRALLDGAWATRGFDAMYDRPLLLFAGLRAEALKTGPGHPLWAAIAGEPPRPETVTAAAVREALSPRWGTLARLAHAAVQTNETSRAVTWTWPAHLLGADNGRRPLAIVDFGTSAGLNLVAEALPAVWTDASGAPVPVVQAADVRLRLGLDRRPLDVRDADAVAWLEACVWPGETARQGRLRAAITAMQAAMAGPRPPVLRAVEAQDMPDAAQAALAGLPPETLVLLCQTTFIEYLPAAVRAQYERGLAALLARHRRAVWLQLEMEPGDASHPAAIRAACVGRGTELRSLRLARTGYHPSRLVIDEAEVAALAALVSF